MKDKSLMKRLGALGFPLFEVEEAEDANMALADVAASKDLRLWDGFPVVLATSAGKGLFDYAKAAGCLKKPLDRPVLSSLVAMSLALYESMNLKFPWAAALRASLGARHREEMAALLVALKEGRDFDLSGRRMSGRRLRSVFNSYFRKEADSLNSLLSAREGLGLEYALSQVFSPKQKELFLKKLKGEPLTKTEREYFSRVVRKKVQALANPDLQRLSQKLLE